MKIKCIALDVANTLLHKPMVLEVIHNLLLESKYDISFYTLKKHHKLVSELIQFPDVTNQDFYYHFNTELLLSLGVYPDDKLLTEIFKNCTYRDWEAFEDTKVLKELNTELVIFSNFNKGLPSLLNRFFEVPFKHVIASESIGVAKPNIDFYKLAIKKVGIPSENILYIGDSLKLDIIPAKQLGMQTLLLDRDEFYPAYPERIVTLESLSNYL